MKMDGIGQRQETVRKSSRNINLVLASALWRTLVHLPKCGTLAHIHYHVKSWPSQHGTLRLRMVQFGK